MTKTKYTPHQEDLKAVKAFLKTVSWGNKCILCTVLDGSAAYLLVPNLYILCPCTWERYNEFKPMVKERASLHGVKAGILIVNEADKQNCERIWWDAHQNSIIVHWLSVANALDADHLTMRGLEGIDWEKSILNVINEGTDAKPVFQWVERNHDQEK
jgi:hypothetical protein